VYEDHEMSVCVIEGEETRMGSHLIQRFDDNPHFFATTGERSTDASLLHSAVAKSFVCEHPTFNLSRADTTEIERQNINIKVEYSEQIETYTRQLE
jgi:hypothetical protein